jgi:uncharacterized membrane protein YgcG
MSPPPDILLTLLSNSTQVILQPGQAPSSLQPVSEAEAEAGISQVLRLWSALRVRQAAISASGSGQNVIDGGTPSTSIDGGGPSSTGGGSGSIDGGDP